jgi:integrase
VEAAQLDDFRFHDLRHTFASWAIQRGASLPELQDLLGHSSHAMVRRYSPPLQSPLHLAPENLRTAVSRLDDVLKSAPSASLGTRQAQEAETLVASK